MMFRAAIALIALTAPAFAQHAAAHGGSFGSRGFAGHAGLSGHPGFSQPNSFVRPGGRPMRYGALGNPRFRSNGPLNYAGFQVTYNGNRFVASRSSSYARDAGLPGTWDRDRAPFAARRRSFEDWYARAYPAWLGYGYPYLIDPDLIDSGFYDGDNSNNSAYDQGTAPPVSPPPYSDEAYVAPSYQPANPGPASPSSPEHTLTLIFKSGRAPVKVQNYLMTARVLTDLDSQHYEQIQLDQIDLAATQRVNSAAGVEFQIPGTSRD